VAPDRQDVSVKVGQVVLDRPQDLYRAGDAASGEAVGVVVVAVDSQAGAVVLAHRTDGVGQFAVLEINSSPPSRRLAQALERVGAGPAAVHFYTEHVEADAVHEQLARRDIIGGLLEAEPGLTADVVFGIDATGFLEDRLSEQLLGAWRKDGSSLRVGL
jgi:hypothetical protein